LNVKEWLNQTRHFNKQIELIKIRQSNYYEHRDLLMEVSCEFTDGINLCMNTIESRINSLFNVRGQIEQMMAQVTDINKRIALESYFLNDKSIAEIAQEEYYSKRHVERLLEDGIKEIEMMLTEMKIPDI